MYVSELSIMVLTTWEPFMHKKDMAGTEATLRAWVKTYIEFFKQKQKFNSLSWTPNDELVEKQVLLINLLDEFF